MNNDLTPCGDDRLDCIDCCGYGICEHTKSRINPDDFLTLEEALKQTFGFDLDKIKKVFN